MNATDEETTTRIFEQELPTMVRRGDVDGYMSLWGGENCRWCPQDVADVCGTDQIHAAVADLFARYTIDPSFSRTRLRRSRAGVTCSAP